MGRWPLWASRARSALGRRLLKSLPADPVELAESIEGPVVEMLRAVGVAMLESGQATNDIEAVLYDIAGTYQLPSVRLIVLPTLVVVQTTGANRRAEIDSVRNGSVRLDQAAAIDDLVQLARVGSIQPGDVVAELERIAASTPRFSALPAIAGHVILSVGFGLILNPPWSAIPVYAVLGAVVGVLVVAGRYRPGLDVVMPVLAAFVTTVLAALFLAGFAREVPVRVIAPALVSFLPGLTLTVAAIELTSNQVIAGSSRLVYGIARLLLLAFGVAAGLTVTGGFSTIGTIGHGVGWWTPYLGIALVALGYVLFLSAPRGALPWLILGLLVTYGAQLLGTALIGASLSGFVGALVVIPFSRLSSRFRSAPAPAVTMLASFWLLVPGALGFIGISTTQTDPTKSVDALVGTGLSLFSIALGILVSTSLTQSAATLLHRPKTHPPPT
jgi:uncharacterized membrane protein YjjP (DUF1212 family)